MSIMEIKQVGYSYDNKKKVLKGVNAEMEQGKLYAILGPSGCGKTTLLSLIGGLDSPGSGQIYFDGQDIAKTGLSDHRKNHVAFIFQAYNLIDYLTPAENVSLTSKLPPLPILERLGLTKEEARRNVLKLSGGQQQRVAIARALASEAPVNRDPQRERPQDEQVCGGRYTLQRAGETGRCGVPVKKREFICGVISRFSIVLAYQYKERNQITWKSTFKMST